MTDGPGHRPRPSTAALLAPAAAALLAGSLAWAAGHPPAPLTKAATTASPTPAPAATERARQLRDVERLRTEVASLRAELTDLAGTDNAGQTGKRGAGGTARATAKPKPKPVRTTPPPVQATTGAS